MKKIIFLSAVLSFCLTLCASGDKIDFYLKVKAGETAIIERIYVNRFGDNFHYDTDKKVFTAFSVTNSEKIAFIDMLKKNGHQIDSTDDPDIFMISVFDNSERVEVYYINSTAFSNRPQYIVSLQQILGSTVSGGEKDVIRRKISELPMLRLSLEKSGFDCNIKGNVIVITEKKFNREFVFPAELQAKVVNVFNSCRISAVMTGNRISCNVTNTELQNIQSKLLIGGDVERITIEKDSSYYIHPVTAQNYVVKIMLNNKFEYEKIEKLIKNNSVFTLTDNELKSNRVGILMGVFSVKSKSSSADEIKKDIWRTIRNAGTRIRERDVRIEKK